MERGEKRNRQTDFQRRVLRRKTLSGYKSPFNKIFNAYGASVWILSSHLGLEFFDTKTSIQRYGAHSVYNYFMAAFLFIIPLWCYLELSSLVCTPGGVYHYAYGLSNEYVGFMVGWLQLLNIFSYTSYIAALTGNFLNAVLFDGALERGVQKYASMDWGVDANTYLNRIPNLLGFLCAIIAAAYSCPVDITHTFGEVAFYVICCFWICYVMLIVADVDLQFFVVPSSKSVSTFFSSYYDVSYMYPTTFNLLYLGGDVEDAERVIPNVIISSYVISWLFYSIVSLLITLVWDIQDIDPFYVLSDILFKTGDHHLYQIIDNVAFICICVTAFAYNVILARLALSMSKDGLIFQIFSRVEHRTRYTAKPSLLLGVIAGVVAIFIKEEFLNRLSKVSELFVTMSPPVLILLLRYTDSFHHILRLKEETTSLNEPFDHIGFTIWAVVISVVVMGYSASQWTADFFINPHYGTTDHAYRIGIAGAVFGLATILLLFQKQNHYKSAYKVPLVPFVPILSLFIQSFLTPVLPDDHILTIVAWMGIGVIFYFTYSMHFSKAPMLK